MLSKAQTDSIVELDRKPNRHFVIPPQIALPSEEVTSPSVAVFACPSVARALPALAAARVETMVAGAKDSLGKYLGGAGAFITASRHGSVYVLTMNRAKENVLGGSRWLSQPATVSAENGLP